MKAIWREIAKLPLEFVQVFPELLIIGALVAVWLLLR